MSLSDWSISLVTPLARASVNSQSEKRSRCSCDKSAMGLRTGLLTRCVIRLGKAVGKPVCPAGCENINAFGNHENSDVFYSDIWLILAGLRLVNLIGMPRYAVLLRSSADKYYYDLLEFYEY